MDNVTLLRLIPLLLGAGCMAVLYFTPYIIGRRKPNAGTIPHPGTIRKLIVQISVSELPTIRELIGWVNGVSETPLYLPPLSNGSPRPD